MEYLLLFIIPIFIVMIAITLIIFAKSYYHNRKHRKALLDIAENSPYRRNHPKAKPANDFLSKDKEKEKNQEIDEKTNQKQKINDKNIKDQEIAVEGEIQIYDPMGLRKNKNQEQIVGLAEPQGFWSRFVMSQKLGYIMARMNNQEKGAGFWVNIIKAQAASQGKDQTKGR